MDEPIEDNVSSTPATMTSQVDRMPVLVCKNCKNTIPLITLTKDESIVKVELNCSLCKIIEKTKVNEYLLFAKALDLVQKCEMKSHHSSNPASRYCLKCLKWICKQCVHDHMAIPDKKHILIPTKLIIQSCKDHNNKKLKLSCETCKKAICKICFEVSHQEHKVKEINNEIIDNIVNKQIFDFFQEMKEENSKVKKTLINLINSKIKYFVQLKEDLQNIYETNLKNNEYIEKLLQNIAHNYESLKHLHIPELFHNITNNFVTNKQKCKVNYSKLEESTINMIKYLKNNCIVQLRQDTLSLGQIKAHNKPITCMIQLHDEKIATGAHDSLIKIWNIQNMQCIKVLNQHKGKVLSLIQLQGTINQSQGGHLISGSDDMTIKIWEPRDWNCIKTLDNSFSGHTGSVWGLLGLKDKSFFISISSDKTFKVWITKSQYILTTTIKEEIGTMIHLFDDRLVSSGKTSKSIQLRDSTSFKLINQLLGHQNEINVIVELKDCKIASGSYSELIIWDMNNLVQLDNVRVNMVYALSYLNDGTLLVGSFNSILFFDSATIELFFSLEGRSDFITSLIELKDKRIAMTTWDSTIQLYNL